MANETLGKVKPAFVPKAPEVLEKLDIPESLVEDLMLRRLYTHGASSIKYLCNVLKLSFPVIQAVFERLRRQQLFEVTGLSGPAPVSVGSYYSAVRAQASKINLNRPLLKEALSDLVLTDRFLDQLGPGLISQDSLFLYGPTGNGKTSVVGRLARIYQDAVVIPYAVEFDGQIIVMYDPAVHQKVQTDGNDIDPRWVVCRRPCISVGGELEPSMLELQLDESSRVYAAPLQMRANNGMLVIDDFGRQIMSPQYLLNRWIVPLDQRVDYLTLRYGVKFEIPFEMIVVFATNLDPIELADEAFLRRIQNKIYVEPVGSKVFDEIFRRLVTEKELPCEPGSAEYLRKLCGNSGNGDLRACYPSDILDILASRAASLYFTRTLTIAQSSSGTSEVKSKQG
jgi:hypothetical protein